MKMGKMSPDDIAMKYNYKFKDEGGETMDVQNSNKQSRKEVDNSVNMMKSPDKTPNKTATKIKSQNLDKKPKPQTSQQSSNKNKEQDLQNQREQAKRLKIEKIKAIQNKEMLQVLEEEQKMENVRDTRLKTCTDEAEKELLEREFGKERSKAQKRIKLMMKSHKEA